MSNSFGKIFKISTYGESHGKAIGVIIDGCPSGIKIEELELDFNEPYVELIIVPKNSTYVAKKAKMFENELLEISPDMHGKFYK